MSSRHVEPIPLDLRYKGGRDYLHGTDIYTAIVSMLTARLGTAEYSGHIIFHQFARQQCEMFVSRADTHLTVPPDRVCDARFSGANGDWVVWLSETARSVEGRYPYDEDSLCADSVIHGNTVSIGTKVQFRTIEVVVALTKYLHNTLFPLSQQRWIFSKLEFSRLLPDGEEDVKVSVLMNLHNRITKCEVRLGGEPFGYIYFSAVPK